jgi:hypothetical protein
MDTGDYQDFKIKFDESIDLIWSENKYTAELSRHTDRG